MQNINIKISTKEKYYPVVIETSLSDEVSSVLREYVDGKKILVIISARVNKLWGNKIFSRMPQAKIFKYVMKDGEKYKNIRTYQNIMNFIQKCEFTREDCILAIGGGVVGDMAGFVASTFMRGIDLIQIPTTLLACVDSSVGGKTGIDTDYGKNIIGTFYQPKAVLICVNFMKTLDERQYKSGLAEVLKYAFIEKTCANSEFFNLFNFINENSQKIKDRDEKILEKLVTYCVTLKKSVVETDEQEQNLRRILNFGHTFGHALEKLGNYKKYTHGEAVAQGMIYAIEKAFSLGLITENYKYNAIEFIQAFGFKKMQNLPVTKLKNIMKRDKKASEESIKFVLPSEYSEVLIRELAFDNL